MLHFGQANPTSIVYWGVENLEGDKCYKLGMGLNVRQINIENLQTEFSSGWDLKANKE